MDSIPLELSRRERKASTGSHARYRWWLCSRFNGHFFGVHALGGEFMPPNMNTRARRISGDNLRSGVRDYRYQGSFSAQRHLRIPVDTVAPLEHRGRGRCGYAHVWYDNMPARECGRAPADGGTNYFGITKLGISFLYLF